MCQMENQDKKTQYLPSKSTVKGGLEKSSVRGSRGLGIRKVLW